MGRNWIFSPFIIANVNRSLMYRSIITAGRLCNKTNDQNSQSVLCQQFSVEAHMVLFRLVPSVCYMSAFVYAYLCVWLLTCNLTAAETKISSLCSPLTEKNNHWHQSTRPNQTEPICAAQWAEMNRGELCWGGPRFCAMWARSTTRTPTLFYHHMPHISASQGPSRLPVVVLTWLQVYIYNCSSSCS